MSDYTATEEDRPISDLYADFQDRIETVPEIVKSEFQALMDEFVHDTHKVSAMYVCATIRHFRNYGENERPFKVNAAWTKPLAIWWEFNNPEHVGYFRKRKS